MSSTNSTSNYSLSQFLGTDKPAWLTDYNSDMSKIDTGIHTAQTTATGADGKATTNTTNIGTLTNLTTTVKSDLVSAINEVDSNADTAQGTANDAYALASANATKIGNLEGALNLNVISNCTVSGTNTTSIGGNTIKCATDTDRSLFKLYGSVVVGATQNTSNAKITISGTNLGARDTAYNIESACLGFRGNGAIDVINITVETTGDVTINLPTFDGTNVTRLYLAPTLYFDKNFGD